MEFNNCIGSLDGNHIVIRPPPKLVDPTTSTHSALFFLQLWMPTYVDIGCNGRISGGGVFKNCNLYKMLEERKLNVPHYQGQICCR